MSVVSWLAHPDRDPEWVLQAVGPGLPFLSGSTPCPASTAQRGVRVRGCLKVGRGWRKWPGSRRGAWAFLRHLTRAFLERALPGLIFSRFGDLGLSASRWPFRGGHLDCAPPMTCHSFPSSMICWSPSNLPERDYSTWTNPLAASDRP